MVVHGDELLVLWLDELVGCFPHVVDCSVVDDIYFVFARGLSLCLFLYFAVFVGAVGFVRDWPSLSCWLVYRAMDSMFRFEG